MGLVDCFFRVFNSVVYYFVVLYFVLFVINLLFALLRCSWLLLICCLVRFGLCVMFLWCRRWFIVLLVILCYVLWFTWFVLILRFGWLFGLGVVLVVLVIILLLRLTLR